MQPLHTPFLIWNQSAVLCPFLIVASWLAYIFLRRQVRWSGIPISWRIFHKFVVIHTVKGFGVVKKAKKFQGKKIYLCFIDYAKAFDCVDHNKLWKILQEIGIPDHLTCLLRNLFAGQEATVKTEHATLGWFQIGKWVHQGRILSPCLFNLYDEYIMWNIRLGKAQAGIKIARRSINNLRYVDNTIHHRKRRGNKKSLDERAEWKNWQKTQHSEN